MRNKRTYFCAVNSSFSVKEHTPLELANARPLVK
jgi:hypothetical protein